jgi:hypothetical protein
MDQIKIHALADSLARMYGSESAQAEARRYADECHKHSDKVGRAKWQAVAALIAELTAPEQNVRNVAQP